MSVARSFIKYMENFEKQLNELDEVEKKRLEDEAVVKAYEEWLLKNPGFDDGSKPRYYYNNLNL